MALALAESHASHELWHRWAQSKIYEALSSLGESFKSTSSSDIKEPPYMPDIAQMTDILINDNDLWNEFRQELQKHKVSTGMASEQVLIKFLKDERMRNASKRHLSRAQSCSRDIGSSRSNWVEFFKEQVSQKFILNDSSSDLNDRSSDVSKQSKRSLYSRMSSCPALIVGDSKDEDLEDVEEQEAFVVPRLRDVALRINKAVESLKAECDVPHSAPKRDLSRAESVPRNMGNVEPNESSSLNSSSPLNSSFNAKQIDSVARQSKRPLYARRSSCPAIFEIDFEDDESDEEASTTNPSVTQRRVSDTAIESLKAQCDDPQCVLTGNLSREESTPRDMGGDESECGSSTLGSSSNTTQTDVTKQGERPVNVRRVSCPSLAKNEDEKSEIAVPRVFEIMRRVNKAAIDSLKAECEISPKTQVHQSSDVAAATNTEEIYGGKRLPKLLRIFSSPNMSEDKPDEQAIRTKPYCRSSSCSAMPGDLTEERSLEAKKSVSSMLNKPMNFAARLFDDLKQETEDNVQKYSSSNKQMRRFSCPGGAIQSIAAELCVDFPEEGRRPSLSQENIQAECLFSIPSKENETQRKRMLSGMLQNTVRIAHQNSERFLDTGDESHEFTGKSVTKSSRQMESSFTRRVVNIKDFELPKEEMIKTSCVSSAKTSGIEESSGWLDFSDESRPSMQCRSSSCPKIITGNSKEMAN